MWNQGRNAAGKKELKKSTVSVLDPNGGDIYRVIREITIPHLLLK